MHHFFLRSLLCPFFVTWANASIGLRLIIQNHENLQFEAFWRGKRLLMVPNGYAYCWYIFKIDTQPLGSLDYPLVGRGCLCGVDSNTNRTNTFDMSPTFWKNPKKCQNEGKKTYFREFFSYLFVQYTPLVTESLNIQ